MAGFPRWGATAAALVLGLARPAIADDASLAEARRDLDQSDYLAARTAVSAALEAGGASPVELEEIYKLSGIVEAALGNTDAAINAFERWIVLDGKAALPAGTSPKIVRPFQSAAARAKHLSPLKVKTETSAKPASIAIVVVSDPLAMIARTRVVVRNDGKSDQTLVSGEGRRMAIDLPSGSRLELRIQVLDAHGNRLVELGTSAAPIVITGAVRTEDREGRDDRAGRDELDPRVERSQRREQDDRQDRHDRQDRQDGHDRAESAPLAPAAATTAATSSSPSAARPLYLKWWIWGGAAGAIGLGATLFGLAGHSASDELQQLNANSAQHDFSEAQSAESRAQRDYLLFEVGIVVAGACAVGGAVLYLTEPKRTVEPRITAVPVRGGGAVMIDGRF
jgi:hypothetical protein